MRQETIKYAKDLLNNYNDLVFLDTETTGLTDTDQVIELGIIDIDGKILVEQLYNPTVEINPFAQKVHGINQKDLIDKPFFKWRYEEIKDKLQNKKVIIFNKIFDIRLIEQTAKAFNLPVLEYKAHCAMKMSGNVFGGNAYISLKDSALKCGLNPENYKAHSAIGDCLLTKDIFCHIANIGE